ncbi:MAG: hypothetical protein IKS42_01070 [Oscillospiraceae bacterium]|nr:hypothetical protein [Oscillospiraceae bacterium]
MYRRIIRVLCVICVSLLCVLAWELPCRAENDALASLYDAADPSEFDLPEAVREQLDAEGVSPDAPETVLHVTPGGFLHTVTDTLKAEAAKPLQLCGALLTLTLLSAVLGSMTDAAASGGMRRLTDMLCVLICAGGAAEPLCACLTRTASALRDGRLFMLSFVPVFSAFIAAGGAVAGSASYQVLVLFLTEGIMQLTASVLYPLLQLAAGLGIVDAVNPSLRLGGFVTAMRKGITWVLGSVMALFSALLSIRGIVASAADTLGAKTARLLISGMIPVVGGAVSDAYGTVQGSIVLLRNGVGAFGMLSILYLTLPPLLSLTVYRAVYALAAAAADLAGTASLAALFRHTQSVLAAAFAMLVCFAVMLIISSAVMLMLLGKG